MKTIILGMILLLTSCSQENVKTLEFEIIFQGNFYYGRTLMSKDENCITFVDLVSQINTMCGEYSVTEVYR